MNPSTSNAVTFNKLDDKFENFDNWLYRIESLLVDCDLWEVCEKEVNVQDPNEMKNDKKAKAKIGQACDDSVVPIIAPAKTAYETINLLKAHAYGGLKKRLRLIKELLSNKYNGNMKEYVSKVLATKESLQGMGAPVDDGFLATFMLAGLPEGFEHIVTRLHKSNPQITSELVAQALLKEGDRAVPGTSASQPTTSQPPEHTCETCGQTFKSSMGLKRHITISTPKGGCSSQNAREGAASASPPKRAKVTVQPAPQPSTTRASASASTSAPTAPSLQQTHTIRSLVPYKTQWTIKAHVTDKSDIQSYKKKKRAGVGKYFTMDLSDESGEIRAVAFDDEVHRFYDMIQVNKSYYINRGQVKPTKKKYKHRLVHLNNDNEIAFFGNTVVRECEI